MVSLAAKATMPTLAAGNPRPVALVRGFTLLELLLVLAIVAFASLGVAVSMRDGAQAGLEREALRLAALLEQRRRRGGSGSAGHARKCLCRDLSAISGYDGCRS